MSQRGLLCGLGLLLAVPATASFELVMVADRGTKSVHRFDGNTGLYLGAFGSGYLQNPLSMALDQAGNRVFVADGITSDGSTAPTQVRVWEFNYNTGEYINSFATGNSGFTFTYLNPQIAYRNDTVAVGFDGRLADMFSTATGLFQVTTAFQSGTNPDGLAFDASGKIWTPEGGTFIQSSLPGGVPTRYTLSSSFAASSVVKQTAISGNRLMGAGGLSWSRLDISTLNSSITNPLTTYTEPTGVTTTNGCGFGHGDIAYTTGTGSIAGGSAYVSRYLYSSGTRLQSFGSGNLVDPRAMAIVVAPEPGSLLALGGALTVLMKRRRSR